MNELDLLIRAAQTKLLELGYPIGKVDGDAGVKTWRAIAQHFGIKVETPDTTEHSVIASTFADPADVEAYKRAKARGLSDNEAFKVGDNGIGVWGAPTTEGTGPSCALPPEDMAERWGAWSEARSKKVSVTYKDRTAICVLKDRMPFKKNRHNGASIDLNPDAAKLLGIPKGGMVRVKWKWAE